jgi:hypothetical protein
MADLGSVGLLLALNVENFQNFDDFEFKISNEPVINERLADKMKQFELLGGPKGVFFLIFGSLLMSFFLLFLEWRKATIIIESRDISYAFTSVVAFRYYAIRSFPHFCLFQQIQNSRKTVDVLAFWVFFKFKGIINLIRLEKVISGSISSAIFASYYFVLGQ